MSTEVRLGIVGCGMVVERGHLPAVAGLRTVRLVSVADPVSERRQIGPGVAAYRRLEEMLAGEQLDAVLVCSPPALHLEHAQTCAALGIPTLVEKPPGLTALDAQRLAALHPQPMIGFNRRFAGGLPVGTRTAKSARRVTAIFDAPPGDWSRGGAAPDPLVDLGCHLVDLACWLTGTHPARARAQAAPAGRVSFEIEMTDGLRLYAQCGAATSYRELIEVRTEQGNTRTWRWPRTAARGALERVSRAPSPLVGSWRAQLRTFADAVRGGKPGRLAPASDGVKVMRALEAVIASAAEGRQWVRVAADPR